MTKEEARKYLIDISYALGNMSIEYLTEKDGDKMREAIETLWQEPCEDAIGRAELLQRSVISVPFHMSDGSVDYVDMVFAADICRAKPVQPQPKTGHWLRMSDLSEQEDDRYKCSRCGNVIHHKNEMNLYTFNSWCGRCGSDNSRHINYETEE